MKRKLIETAYVLCTEQGKTLEDLTIFDLIAGEVNSRWFAVWLANRPGGAILSTQTFNEWLKEHSLNEAYSTNQTHKK